MIFFRITAFNQFIGALVLLVFAAVVGVVALDTPGIGLGILLWIGAAVLLCLCVGAVLNGLRVMTAWFRIHFGWRVAR